MPLSGAAMISENTAAASSSRCVGSLFFATRGARAKVVIRMNLIFLLIPVDRACPRGRWIDVVVLSTSYAKSSLDHTSICKAPARRGVGDFARRIAARPRVFPTFKKRHLIPAKGTLMRRLPSTSWKRPASLGPQLPGNRRKDHPKESIYALDNFCNSSGAVDGRTGHLIHVRRLCSHPGHPRGGGADYSSVSRQESSVTIGGTRWPLDQPGLEFCSGLAVCMPGNKAR